MKRNSLLKISRGILLSLISLIQFSCISPTKVTRATQNDYWLGVHVLLDSKDAVKNLKDEIPALAINGVNLVITEIDYNFEFQSHPELRGKGHITKDEIKDLLEVCNKNKILLVPEFQCLGHQSLEKETFPLLAKYQQFDETPNQYPNNDSIYYRSWCPLHPDINPIIFDLFSELIDAFNASILHVGMDEVFLIGSEFCPRCKGKNPADLFAKAVNDYHKFLSEHNVEMMMWGDRLLNSGATGYNMYESSANYTHQAINKIPNDIIICDWHYELQNDYPSIPVFLEKGFRVLPSSWQDTLSAEALINYSLKFDSKNMLGHLCCTWNSPAASKISQYPTIQIAAKKLRRVIP
jgi:hypothetical protein